MKTNFIRQTIEGQRNFFNLSRTKKVSFRLEKLRTLKRAILENENKILEAVRSDFKKPIVEAYISEEALLLNEIDYALKNLSYWLKPRKVNTPLHHFPSSAGIYPEPYGVVLIMAPWNYPFYLALGPLVGAIAAGNCAVLKPSEFTPNTSKLILDIISGYFDERHVAVIEGATCEAQILLREKFDYIFFTGSPSVGKIVMEAAAKHLTPVTLELGGKNPCIVDKGVNVPCAARRIVFGKFFNAGQTCVAPDYLLAHKDVKKELLSNMVKYMKEFYGTEPVNSYDYGRIVNEKHLDRLCGLLHEGDIITGGDLNRHILYLAPTVIDNVGWASKIMSEEIFGPVLPVITYDDLDEVISIINERPKPLVVYLFSNDAKNQDKVLNGTSSGAFSVNDTLSHAGLTTLPFGGVGESGMGAYHGRASFDAFTHYKSVFKKSLFFDPKIKYPPYKKSYETIKKILKW